MSDKILGDMDKMPFGVHRNKMLLEVPASYFHYLWTHGMEHDRISPVADYIRRNLNALKQEHTDGIW